MTTATTVQHPASADAYIRNGWSLVPIPPGSKGPRHVGWNRREAALRSQAEVPPGFGIGLAHAYSGTMALDIDDWDTAAPMLALFGVDLQALYDAPDAVIVDSGRQGHGKLLYAMPFGLALPTKKVEVEGRTIYEVRCATAEGLTVQDVLPPTIHPDTQQPYRWAGRGHWTRLPTVPVALLDVWQALLDSDRPATMPTGEPSSASWEEIRSALAAIPADCSREEWITCGMAIHHAAAAEGNLELGFAVWNEWSATAADKYPGERALMQQWRSFRSDKSTAVRLGSLFHLAKRHGWVPPPPDASALFASAEPAVAPEDIISDLRTPMPAIDLDWFPPVLAQRARDVSESVGCDPIVPLFAGLAAVCGAMDARSRLRLMDGYEVPPVLWLMTIGSPADKKTPGSSPMIDVLHDIEREDLPNWKARLLAWEGQEAFYNAQKKDYLDKAADATRMANESLPVVPDLPPQPQPLRIKVSDITSQKLVRYAAERPRGLLCYLDEMGGWVRKMSDRTSIEDRSAWVQAYEAKRYEYDRVGGGAIIADCFAVGVYGNIQPLVYKDAIESLSTDGLLQRFVPGLLNTRLTRRGEPLPHHRASIGAWEHAVRLVYALPPTTYTLAPDALELFREFQTWFERSKHDEVLMEAEVSFLTAYGKLEGTAARLALLCHVLTEPFSAIVSRDTMARAIDMVRTYVIPALRYCLAELGGVEILEQWIQQWLLYHIDNRQTVTLSEVKRAARRKLEKYTNIWMQDRAVIDAMGTLETARWVVRLDDGTREHLHQAEWAVNPKIKDAFTRQRTEIIVARQRAEDERRRIAKLARRIVPGFDPETMEPMLRAG